METAALLQPMSARDIREKHREELENLTLASQPLRTLKFFVLAVVQGLQRLFLAKSFRLLLLISSSAVVGTISVLLITNRGHNEMDHVREILIYLRFGLWWLGLGVASSIGLGSGLHTFVLYLGPHIALFTIKAVQCGRVDIKSASYDTIQLNSGPSWLDKNCTAFGPPLFSSLEGARVPLTNILLQVQLEAILWGIGTALGELPPYFISRAASLSGSEVELLKELDSSSAEDATMFASHMKQIKGWLLSHSQYLNFSTILILASVPNPLFDLAGIMCGQFGVPFWEFFLATLIGKAIIKTHIQTAFIISVCNYQLLDFVENELIRLLSFVPGLSSILPNVVAKLQLVRKKYLEPSAPVSNVEAKRWNVSVAAIWNTVIWLMLITFFVKIVTATAQSFLKEQQEKLVLANDSPSSSSSSPE